MTPATPHARERLRRGRVLVVGVGGLGAPAACQLAAAGVGTIGLVDGDVVELSNLHRQILYRTGDVGSRKVSVAARRLSVLFPEVTLRPFDARLSADNARAIVRDFDFVIDGTDAVASKYLVNDTAVLQGVPFSHAGVVGFQGQTFTVVPGASACVRCLFPTPPDDDDVPTCQYTGVIGPLAGTLGAIQASEALKHVTGSGRLLTNHVLTYDALRGRWRRIEVARNPGCPLCGAHPTIHRPAALPPAGACG